MDSIESIKQRIVTAALRVAAAERGGLDQVNADEEYRNASALLDDSLRRFLELASPEA